MRPVQIVEAVLAAGGVLESDGNHIRYRLPKQATPLLDELRRHKADVLYLLRQREFANLLPFLGKRVWSPDGPGI